MIQRILMALVLLTSTYASAQTNAELNKKLNALIEEVQSLKNNKDSTKINFGGYGEIIYSKSEAGEDDTVGGDPTFDNKRFILYVGYDFSSKFRLVSEIEIEHADEIYMEQAYIEYLIDDKSSIAVGTLLIPVGLTNLKHEPTTFLSAQRSQTESRIIPTTWRENGIQYSTKLNDHLIKVFAVNGLLAENGSNKFNASGVRNGRQKASQANARDLAIGVRYDYMLNPSAVIGGSLYNASLSYDGSSESPATHRIVELHYDQKVNAFDIKVLMARGIVDGAEELNTAIGSNVASEMNGSYIELGYDLNHGKSDVQIIPFVRLEKINTHAVVDDNITEDKSKDETHSTFGVNYKPLANIVFKADYTKSKNEAKTATDSWNLGLGWNF